MKTITKPHPKKTLRHHFYNHPNMTLCGIYFPATQETILDCDCRRCLRIIRVAARSRRVANRRLNGRTLSPGQTTISLTIKQ